MRPLLSRPTAAPSTIPRGLASRLVGIAAVLLALVNSAKGLSSGVQAWGLPFWLMTYEHGFIKRGLVGTLFQAGTSGLPLDRQTALVPMLHLVTCAVFGAVVLLPTVRDLAEPSPQTDRQTSGLRAAALLLAACSPCLPAMVHLTGYMDPLLFVLAFAAYGCASRGRLVSAAILCAIGPFVHEAFLFVWLGPAGLLLMQGRRDGSWRRAGVIALVPLLATAVVLAFHSPSAATAMVASAPLEASIKNGLLRYQFGLRTGDALTIMLAHFRAWPTHVLLAGVAFLLPSVLVATCAVLIARRSGRFARWELAALVGCALVPAGVLCVAWDLSRLLVWTMPTSMLVLHFVAKESASRDPQAPARSRASVTIALAATCAFFALVDFASPSMFAYFDAVAADYEVAMPGIDGWPPAHVGYLFVNAYNRHRALDVSRPQDLTAQLSLHGPSHPTSAPGSPLDVDSTAVALGNGSPLAPGAYDVSFDLDVTSGCRGGDVAVTAIAVTRWPHPLFVERESVSSPRVVVLRMVVDDHDAALGPVDVRIQGLEGCVHVNKVLLATAR